MAVRFADPALPGLPLRGRRTSALAAVAGVGALAAAAALDPARIEDGPVLCPVRLLTGLPCPGCGLTRSWVYVAHGEWGDAWAANPFGIVSVLAVAAFVLAVAVAVVRRTTFPEVGRVASHPAFLAIGGLWIAYGVGRVAWMLTG